MHPAVLKPNAREAPGNTCFHQQPMRRFRCQRRAAEEELCEQRMSSNAFAKLHEAEWRSGILPLTQLQLFDAKRSPRAVALEKPRNASATPQLQRLFNLLRDVLN